MLSLLEKLNLHISQCQKCTRANKRANDFCLTGKVLFRKWAAEQQPRSVTILSEAESQRIVAAEQRKAGNN